MKCYICLTAPDDSHNVYIDMLNATLKSARNNTSLDLYALYDGPIEHKAYKLLEFYNVNIIKHSFSHKEYLEKVYPKEFLLESYGKIDSYNKIAGTFMRMDIPFFEKTDDFVLYVDIDVIFIKDIKFDNILLPEYLAACPEYSKNIKDMDYFNAGVLLFNVKGMREKCQQIFEMLKRGERNKINLFDQGYLNQVCFSNMELLPLEYNWKPYWGINENAKIIHFHGIKPGGTLENSGFCTKNDFLYKPLIGHEEDLRGYIYYNMLFFQTINKDGKLWLSEFVGQTVNALYNNTETIGSYKKKKDKYKTICYILAIGLIFSLLLNILI